MESVISASELPLCVTLVSVMCSKWAMQLLYVLTQCSAVDQERVHLNFKHKDVSTVIKFHVWLGKHHISVIVC